MTNFLDIFMKLRVSFLFLLHVPFAMLETFAPVATLSRISVWEQTTQLPIFCLPTTSDIRMAVVRNSEVGVVKHRVVNLNMLKDTIKYDVRNV
jgi:hypothetical protein